MVACVVFGVGPNVPELMGSSGMFVPNYIKFICALVAATGAVVGYRLPAQKNLASDNDTGKNSSGGPGVTLGGAPHPALAKALTAVTAPPTPPAAARLSSRSFLGLVFTAIAMAYLAVLVACGANPPSVNTVTTEALTVEGTVCFVDELADPLLPVGTVQVIASWIQNACQKSIPQTLTTLVAQLITGIMGPSPDAGPDGGTSAARPNALRAILLAHVRAGK
jgi:hypothetical protein